LWILWRPPDDKEQRQMEAANLLRELEKLHIELWVEGEQLKFRAPYGLLTDELRHRIGLHKREFIRLLLDADSLSTKHSTQLFADDDLPLTPNQAWYVDTFDPGQHAWATTVGLQFSSPVPLARLRAAVEFFLHEHDVFRLRLYRTPDGRWAQRMLRDAGPAVLSVYEVAAADEIERSKVLAGAAHHVQSSLSIVDGPVLALGLCTLSGAETDTIIFSVHKCVVDGYSLTLALGELLRVYQALAAGQQPNARATSSTYRDYLLGLDAYMHQPAFLARALSFWRSPARSRPVVRLPVDVPGGRHTTLNSRRIVTPLEPALLHEIESYLGSHRNLFLNDVLLFALAQAHYQWTGERALRLDVEYHGRDVPGLQLLETIGPMTVKVPMLIEFEPEQRMETALSHLRDRVRETEENARGYGFFQYKCADAEIRQEIANAPPPQTFLNNRTRLGGGVRHAQSETIARAVGLPQVDLGEQDVSEHLVSYDLMIECDNFENSLMFSWVYSSASYRAETIRALSQHFISSLRAVANNSASSGLVQQSRI
jgi:hypothetical protein